ncbi:bifunctional lysine-specific demethylase and histidyl-hydroxylase NO66-like protein [Dinothrombium tinctorium]|uniref:Bifunctional lysine-specific demethylase and histidyl-hydroxylase n=1 Tax=Dinothrombium tinctorium TaxID=1965070 RepID=A0A3S3PFY5_9ACAR|nr:bifunctional lysine-specific demethylase and histidyl-hydroxylase NO66-like protein [Dinothrombium tinctorium]RWS13448.1 bifunctional lysine-specific demethylase and histidyl-hydroxylase NO66-like protein [Dinothrombium tinctorium]RWS13592.1 bifunctional lysine-specific demethylase and histidyl-hydroxylase NO66-like protein [Dinothrombium tinctorium]
MKVPKKLSAFSVYSRRLKEKKKAKRESKAKSKTADLSLVSNDENNAKEAANTSLSSIVNAAKAMDIEESHVSDSADYQTDDNQEEAEIERERFFSKTNKIRKSWSRSDPGLRIRSKLKRRLSSKQLNSFRTIESSDVSQKSFPFSSKAFHLKSASTSAIPSYLNDSRIQARKCFEWLINPFKTEQFFKEIWEKKPLLLKRKQNDYYHGVFSTAEFDTILRENHVQFTRNIDITSYSNDERKTLNPDGRAYPAIVWDNFQNGCSVRFLNPQTYSRSVWKLNSVLQEYFGSFVGANIYLTPAGSQGFAPHYDDIEAFILQLEGKKVWRVYAPADESDTLPRYSSGNLKRSEIDREPLLQVELEPGDLLYFPRGFVHEAKTTEETYSLHITLSVSQKNTFGDLLEILLPQALQTAIAEDIEFRESLPRDCFSYMGIANQEMINPQRYDFLAKIQSLMGKVINYAHIDAAVDQKAKGFIHDCLPPVLNENTKNASIHSGGEKWVNGHIEGSVELEPDIEIKLIRHGVVRLVMEEDTVRLYHTLENSRVYHEFEPQYIDIGADKAPAVEYLLRSYPNYISIDQLPLATLDDKVR